MPRFMPRSRPLWVLYLGFLLGLIPGRAHASYSPQVVTSSLSRSGQIQEGRVFLSGGFAVLIGVSSSQPTRLDSVVANFNKGLHQSDDLPRAWVRNLPATTVLMGDTVLFSVTDLDLKVWKQNGLAWPEGVMGTLNKAISRLPSIKGFPSRLSLPIGDTRHFRLMEASDLSAYSLSISTENPENSFAYSLSEEGVLSLTGLQPGSGWVRFTKGVLYREVWVECKYQAGLILPGMTLFLSNPLPQMEDIRTFARAAIATHVFEREGAKTTLKFNLPTAFTPGSQLMPVKVQIQGQGYFELTQSTNLEIRVQPLTPMRPKMLYMSNSPERVKGPQRLFEGPIEPVKPVRLMLHHLNDTKRKILYSVKLANPGNMNAAIYVQGASGGPDPHETALGFALGKRFISVLQQGKGMGLVIPPQSQAILWRQVARPGEVVSLLDNLEATGEGMVLTVDALWADGYGSEADRIENTHPELVFSYPEIDEEVVHHTMSSWQYINLGRLPPESGANQHHIRGNFGGIETFHIKFENDDEVDRKIWIKFDPAAGYAGGLFLIDGKLLEVRPTATREETVIYRDLLGPGGKRSMEIQSLTLPGSNYPAKLIVASDPRIVVKKDSQ